MTYNSTLQKTQQELYRLVMALDELHHLCLQKPFLTKTNQASIISKTKGNNEYHTLYRIL